MVKYKTYLLVSQFRRQISIEFYYRVGLQAYQLQQLLGLAAANTSSSFFIFVALLA